jgi:mersacidin/lichenicidin family type 2 lantibiotic
MSILSAWKNTRQSSTTEAQASLSVNLIGEVELTDADLDAIHGGSGHGGHSSHSSYDNNHNINLLNGTYVLSDNNILNGAVANVGVLGTGSSNSFNRESGHGHRC